MMNRCTISRVFRQMPLGHQHALVTVRSVDHSSLKGRLARTPLFVMLSLLLLASLPLLPHTFDFETDTMKTFTLEAAASITTEKPISGKRSLLIDTMQTNGQWNLCFRTVKGILKADTDYVATLTMNILEQAKGAFVHIVIRPLDVADHTQDAQYLSFHDLNRTRRLRIKFRTKGRDTYAVQIYAHKQLKSIVDDIVITEGSGDLVQLAEKQARSSSRTFPTPLGQPDFAIQMPRSGTGMTLSVADFGASSTNEDNTKAFNDTFVAARVKNASRIVVPNGVYRFTSDTLLLDKLTDIDFDGQGSEFIFLKTTGSMFRLNNTERLILHNFSIDWDWKKEPLASLVKLETIGEGGASVDMRFVDYDDFPKKDVRIGTIEAVDPQTLSVGIENGAGLSFTRLVGRDKVKFEWLSGNLLRIYQDGNPKARAVFAQQMKPGQLFRIRHYIYEINCFVMKSNAHLTFSNVTIYSTPGMAFNADGTQHHWQLLGTRIKKRPGSKNPITCTADHLHVTRSLGWLKLDGCEFSFGGDDCLNVHDISCFAIKTGSNAITTKYFYRNIPASWKTGDQIELRNDDYSPTGFVSTFKSMKVLKDGVCELTFDRPVPTPVGEGFILFNWAFSSEHLIIRNSFFHNNQSRGLLLLTRNATVENNKFFHNHTGAIHILTGYTSEQWSEGYGVSNIIIRGNTFDTANPAGGYGGRMRPDICIDTYMKSDPSETRTSYPILKDILIENNRFVNPSGAIVYICSASNVTLRGNTVVVDRSRENNHPYRGSIGAVWASDIRIVNNMWIRSPFVTTPGLIADLETVSGILFEGNTVDDK